MSAILLISPEPWQAHAVSKHHYAIQLARLGHRVFFLDPPDSTLVDFSLSQDEDIPNLTFVRGPRAAPGLRFSPAVLRRWVEGRWLKRFERRIGCRIDIIWLFENSRFFDMDFAGDRLKIYHQVDLNQNFHPVTAARTANVCFCTSDGIRAQLLPHNPRTYKIHHGTAVPAHTQSLSAEQSALFLHGGPNAVYIGNLDMLYLDAELLAQAVQAHPSVCFHFVGGYSPQGHLHKLTSHLSNVVWWGKVASQLIPSILAQADVVLCAYKAEQYGDQLASPHKFMEYLASGKCIVATYTDEYKDKRHLLEMVDHASDYPAALSRVLSDLAYYNSQERQAQRVAFAMSHTYPRQLDAIFSILQQHGLAAPLTSSTQQ